MEETVILNDGERRFVEEMGLHFERLGAARIGGQLLGLLLVAARPLALDEMVAVLGVSKASVSTNTRMFLQIGIIELTVLPGDRRRFYVFSHDAWEHRLQVGRTQAMQLQRLIDSGRRALAPDNTAAQERLEVAGAFATFLEGASADMLNEWRARHQALERKRA